MGPWRLVLGSTIGYGVLLTSITRMKHAERPLRNDIKAISSIHASIATILAIVALWQKWHVPIEDVLIESNSQRESEHPKRLNDQGNVLIYGKSALANAITSWETGYLIYDLGALTLNVWPRNGSIADAIKDLAKKVPVFFGHHVLLISALGILQEYIRRGRDRGMWVITAFFLAYASNPILHLRWQRRQTTGKQSLSIDLLLATTFAASRFGSVYWILKTYADHHGLGTLDAFNRQRRVCKTGTLTLVGMNAVWWVSLLRGIATRSLKNV